MAYICTPRPLTCGWMRLTSAETGASAVTRKVGKHCRWLLLPEIQRQSSGLLRREVMHTLRPALLNAPLLDPCARAKTRLSGFVHTIMPDVSKYSMAQGGPSRSIPGRSMGTRGIVLPPDALPWQKGVAERVALSSSTSLTNSTPRTLQPNETPRTLEMDAGEVR